MTKPNKVIRALEKAARAALGYLDMAGSKMEGETDRVFDEVREALREALGEEHRYGMNDPEVTPQMRKPPEPEKPDYRPPSLLSVPGKRTVCTKCWHMATEQPGCYINHCFCIYDHKDRADD